VTFWKRPAFWIVVAAAVAAVPLARWLSRRAPKPLADYGAIAAFRLVDQTGAPFSSDDLRGQVWVANFIFTRCPTICPALTGHMKEIESRAKDVRLVSFSVDPTHDTPPVLAAYAQAHGAGPRWTFVTGDYAAVDAAVVKGLKQAMEPIGKDQDLATVRHSPYVVLVDRELRMRGYYDMNEPGAVDRVVRDAKRLAR
jgi:protein SCO1/2